MNADDYERYAHDQIDALRREYELKARPYIEILCKIQAMKAPKFFITLDQLEQLDIKFPLAKP